jgi:hydrogenase maturation protein HypF
VQSPHVGDLETPEALDALEQVAEVLPRFLGWAPERVAVDLHPDMHSTRLGRRLAAELQIPLVEVQHHHAHAASCLAEHGVESGLALVLDGTGLGSDGAIWGAELLEITPAGFRRLATFEPVPLPGGDLAVRRPVRQLLARWVAGGAEVPPEVLRHLRVSPDEAGACRLQCERGLNAPPTHAAGRLFDSFAALLGIAPDETTYEGQPAIRLEATARGASRPGPELPFRESEAAGLLRIDWAPLFLRYASALPSPDARAPLALSFHTAVARACRHMVEFGFAHSALRTVALSGGVFMNRRLSDAMEVDLQAIGAQVLIHRNTPPNDGGIAMGQAALAGRS